MKQHFREEAERQEQARRTCEEAVLAYQKRFGELDDDAPVEQKLRRIDLAKRLACAYLSQQYGVDFQIFWNGLMPYKLGSYWIRLARIVQQEMDIPTQPDAKVQ